MLRLINGLFILFLIVTVVFVLYTLFVPTPTEWGIATGELQRNTNSTGPSYVAVPNATSFPSNFNLENLTKAEFRHLAVIPEYITGSFLINTINFAFLTMFIRNIYGDIEDAIDNERNGRVKMHVYVEWAMGALISGILFFSSSVAAQTIITAILYLVVIVVFAIVSTYILYGLRENLKKEDKTEKSKEKQEVESSRKEGRENQLRISYRRLAIYLTLTFGLGAGIVALIEFLISSKF